MTYWTLENNGVEKTFKDWGLSKVVLPVTSQSNDDCTFVAENQAVDAAPLFAKLSECIIRRERELQPDGSYINGTQFFRGVLERNPRSGNAGSESVKYQLAGLWWYFENLPFEQSHREYAGVNGSHCSGSTNNTCEVGYVTDGTYDYAVKTNPVVVLNQTYTGAKMTVAEQVKEILDFLIAKGAPFAYDSGEIDAEFGTLEVPTTERPDVTCALALITELAWIPDCETWFDYSQTTPVFHVRRRANLPVLNISAVAGVQIENLSIVERDELQKTQVVIQYRIANSVDGRSWVAFQEDKYPASPSNPSPFTKLKQSVDIIGYSGSNQSAALVTSDFPADLNDQTWWKARVDWLNNVTISSIHGAARTPTTRPRLLEDGNVAEWMIEAGEVVVAEDCKVTALADIVLADGTVKRNELISFQCRATNGQTGTYTKFTLSQGAEPVPVGLAEQIYTALSEPQYEGSFDIVSEEVLASIAVGKKVNLIGGLAEWEDMNMPIKSVTYDVDEGRVSATFGVNRYLSAGELVELMRVTRNRQITSLTIARASASSPGGDVVAGKTVPNKNSLSGPGNLAKQVISESTTPGGGLSVVHDGTQGQTEWRSGIAPGAASITENGVRIKHSEAQGKLVRLREMEGCDPITGAKKYCMTLRSEWYDAPLTNDYEI